MSKQKQVRIGNSSAAWGDTVHGVSQLVAGDQVDYIVGDYLAEVTMAILSKIKAKNPEAGYVPDWGLSIKPHLNAIKEKGIRLVTNAGGMNPQACRDAFVAMAKQAGLDFKVAVVSGDDLMSQEGDIRQSAPIEMFNSNSMPEKMASMNAYLGAEPVKKALDEGADVVITGRVVDTAVVLGILMHEYQWSSEDYHLLSAGSLAGHIIECGCQATGGLFTDWQDVSDDWDNMGFPIVECQSNGDFTVTKAENTGGLVSVGTVSEQIVYEIGDPEAYLLPDVTCDFSHVKLSQTAPNKVLVTGARGSLPSNSYKVCGTYVDGFKLMTTYMLAGWQAGAKAKKMAEKLVERTERLIKAKGFEGYREVSIEVIGANDTYPESYKNFQCEEVVVKIGLRHSSPKALNIFSTEFAVPAVSMAQGITGVFNGRPQPSPVVRVHSFLYDKANVPVSVEMDGDLWPIKTQAQKAVTNKAIANVQSQAKQACRETITALTITDLTNEQTTTVPLRALAWGRSGDKGNHANIGIIARSSQFFPFITAQINEAFISQFFSHYLQESGQQNLVIGYELPGFYALNFMLENVLGGGGSASLRYDPQAKTFAQMLLDEPVAVPTSWLDAGGVLEAYSIK